MLTRDQATLAPCRVEQLCQGSASALPQQWMLQFHGRSSTLLLLYAPAEAGKGEGELNEEATEGRAVWTCAGGQEVWSQRGEHTEKETAMKTVGEERVHKKGGQFGKQYKEPLFSYPITGCFNSPKLTAVVQNNYRLH